MIGYHLPIIKEYFMKLSLAVFASLGILSSAHAVKLSDYKPFAFEALFTNPVCETYAYDRPLITNSGKTVLLGEFDCGSE
jgi:hypothetical protein